MNPIVTLNNKLYIIKHIKKSFNKDINIYNYKEKNPSKLCIFI